MDRDPMAKADLALIFKALDFAALKHRDQRRKDSEQSPYINHPIALANVLINEGQVTDPLVIADRRRLQAGALGDLADPQRAHPAARAHLDPA